LKILQLYTEKDSMESLRTFLNYELIYHTKIISQYTNK